MKGYLGSKLHISWLIAWLAGGFLVGVTLAQFFYPTEINHIFWPIIAVLVITVSFACHLKGMVILVLFAGLMLGFWRGGLSQKALSGYQNFYGRAIVLTGKVSKDANYQAGGGPGLTLKNVEVNGKKMPGEIWTSLAKSPKIKIKRSDIVSLQGKLKTGFGSFPASMSFAKLKTLARGSQQDYALRFRDWFSNGINRAIPDPQSALASGYLMGQQNELPGQLDQNLKTISLTHAVVASGYNLTILVAFARRLFMSLSKYLATLSAGLMIAAFMMITGFSPSMTRAGLVTGLSLAAWYCGRKIHPLVLLPFAAAITVAINPSYAWGNVGWELSFAAFAGVLLLGPLIHHYFWGIEKPGFIREILVSTTAAQLATLPILISAFGHYSPYALLANLLVLPLIPATMLLTFISGIAGLAVPSVAHVIAFPVTIILKYMMNVINWTAGLPGANSLINLSVLITLASYLAIILLAVFFWRKTGHSFRHDNEILIGEN